jgi:hypothetical protein
MRSKPSVRSCKPTLESLESRDLPSAIPNVALQYLLPLAQEFAANSSAALMRLQATDATRTSIITAASHPTNNSAATTYAQAASAFQEVLTHHRELEISFIADLHFFQGVIQTEDPANQLADNTTFITVVEPLLNVPRQQVINNETTALGLGIVNNGINTIGTPGFVSVTTGINSPVNIDITFPPLRPSLGAGVVTVPTYNFTTAMWPFLPPGYMPPNQNP